MHIKDTAGQEDYKAINEIFYKQANGILLVYDVTNSYSFDEIQDYYCKKIEDNCNKDIKVILLGNKSDLENERQIQPEEGATFAAKKGFMFMETSCLKNKNVSDEMSLSKIILICLILLGLTIGANLAKIYNKIFNKEIITEVVQ